MAQEFVDCSFHGGLVTFTIRYDEDNHKVDAVVCDNQGPNVASFRVRVGNQVFSDFCLPGNRKQFNIPPGILNQMVLGFDGEEPEVVSTTNSNFRVEYRA